MIVLMNPNQDFHNPQGVVLPTHQSRGPLIVAILMTVAFIAAASFGVWAFIGMQDNQSNLDTKIEAASEVAVQKSESAKEVEFAEREKEPFKTYSGTATFGSLSFSYPKTWSIYLEEKTSGTILDFFGHPNVIAGFAKENNFALRAQILAASYDSEVEKIQKLAEKGKVTITAFRLVNVPDALGIRAVGEIATDKQGVMILLPQRDKTFKFWTESAEFAPDFEKVAASINFIP